MFALTHHTARRLSLLIATPLVMLASVATQAAAQMSDGEVIRLGMVGAARADQVTGATISGGAMFQKGALSLTALGEGFFFHGRPDARFQEQSVTVVYPNAPLVEVQEIQCEDPTTNEIFARGKCQVGQANLSGTIDLGIRGSVGQNEILVGVGYKLGSTNEPYVLLGLSGVTASQPGGWVARLAVSKRSVGFKIGYAIS